MAVLNEGKTLKERIKDYFSNRQIDIFDDGYWTFHERTGFSTDTSCSYDYDGKFVFRRDFQAIDSLLPKLNMLITDKLISGFKYKNSSSPITEKYRDMLPPVMVFCRDKQKGEVTAYLNSIGIEDMVWIGDPRSSQEITRDRYFEEMKKNPSYLQKVN